MTEPRPSVDFDPIAPAYRWLEYLTLGPLLQQTRTHFLTELSACRHALVLGDGDGRFLARLLSANRELHVDAVDTSAAMLHLLHDRCAATVSRASSRLQTHHEDALAFTPHHRPDLIVTHFFLDCLTQKELNGLALRLAGDAAPRALWVVSDFRIPPRGVARLPARIFVRLLYLAFRILTGLRTTRLPDHVQALASAGYIRIEQHLSLAGVLTTELWQLRSA